MNEQTDERHASAGQVERPVRPAAWLREQRDLYEGRETNDPFFVLGWPRPVNFANGATYEPLYDKAALEAAVAAERERIKAALIGMDDAAAGRHNYYAHAAWLIFGPNAKG